MKRRGEEWYISDEEIINMIVKDNDTRLFEILYDKYSNVVYNNCLRFVNSQVEAQDLTHDIFVKLFLKLKMFNNSSKFSTWLYSITYNHCLNYLTREKKRTYDNINIDDNKIQIESQMEVEDKVIYGLCAEILVLALNKMAIDEKMILLMKYQDDLSIKDLMNILGLGESAVKMRLSRAKNNLLKIYKVDYEKSF